MIADDDLPRGGDQDPTQDWQYQEQARVLRPGGQPRRRTEEERSGTVAFAKQAKAQPPCRDHRGSGRGIHVARPSQGDQGRDHPEEQAGEERWAAVRAKTPGEASNGDHPERDGQQAREPGQRVRVGEGRQPRGQELASCRPTVCPGVLADTLDLIRLKPDVHGHEVVLPSSDVDDG